MSDLVIYTRNHSYDNDDAVVLSWLDGIYYVADKNINEFKLVTASGGSEYLQYTNEVTSGSVREIDTSLNYVNTITGLEHIEGELVNLMFRGKDLGEFTVVDGKITSPERVYAYSVGKPYTSTVTPMRLDIGEIGFGDTYRINRAFIDLYKTVGGEASANGTDWEGIETGTDSLFEGFKKIPIPGGYTRDDDFTIRQTEPLPMTIRSLTYDLGASND